MNSDFAVVREMLIITYQTLICSMKMLEKSDIVCHSVLDLPIQNEQRPGPLQKDRLETCH